MNREEALKVALEDTQTEWGASRFNSWRRCPREHELRYEEGIVPVHETEYLGIGRLVHSCLAYAHIGARQGEIFDFRDVIDAVNDDPRSVPEILDEAERLLSFYFLFYGRENGGWPDYYEIIGVEKFLGSEGSPRFTTRLDLLFKIGDEFVICDTKTRSTKIPHDREGFARGLQISPQFAGQAFLVQREFDLPEPPDVILNVIVKTKKPQFDRLRIRMPQAAVDRWAAAQERDAEEIFKERYSSARMNLISCAPPIGRRCQYFDFCHAKSDEAREKFFKKET